jgi:hypothetical protein
MVVRVARSTALPFSTAGARIRDAVDEVVVSEATAEQLDLQAGSRLELVSYGPDRGALLARGRRSTPAARR